jgi:DNA-binding IscR family transcriptional regulator
LDGGELFHTAALAGTQAAKLGLVLKKVFESAEGALREELEKTTLNDLAKKVGKKGKK